MSNLKRVSLYIMYITDLAALLLAFFIAYPIRSLLPVQEIYVIPELSIYTPLLLGTVIAYIIVAFILLYNENFIGRSAGEEVLASIRMIAIVMALDVFIFYFTKTSERYSRLYLVVFAFVALILDILFRLFVKKVIIPLRRRSRGIEHLILVTEEKRAAEIKDRLENNKDWRFQITGLILVDCDKKGKRIQNLPVISNRSEALTDILDQEVDSVLLALPDYVPEKEWVDVLQSIGKTVYIHLDQFYYSDARRMLDYLGDCAVVSYQPAMPVRGRSLVIKRGLDGVAAVALLPVLLALNGVAAIVIKITSGGPVLVGRERIGKNGRRFHMFHFRTLRNDAEKRIQEGQNPFTGFGRFLRFTHLDGLPMIYNILVGDMSFVGPQAVTEEQIRTGNLNTIRNLCTRPGMVGVWSTRRADGKKAHINEYIHTWSLRLDAKLLLSSILQFLTGRSGRTYTEKWSEEENRILMQYTLERQPLLYDQTAYVKETGANTVWYNIIKRFIDIIGSLLGIIILSWLFLILIILVIADDGGNPFYGHQRIGKNGKRIKVLKFRSMRQDAGDLAKLLTPEQLEQYRTEFKIDNDPRITRIGSILRKTSLDELPQLFNILKGDLSIVGPRPIVEKETEIYGKDIAKLLSVKPGLTGYWQAYARNNATYETGERQQMEMYYIEHQSLALDLRIIFRTVKSVSKQEGAQ